MSNALPLVLSLLLIAVPTTRAAAAGANAAAATACPVAAGNAVHADSSCQLDVSDLDAAAPTLQLRGRGGLLSTMSLTAGAPQPAQQQRGPGVREASISNVILESSDSFPVHSIDLAHLLRPPLLVGADTAVTLVNVVLLHTLSPEQAPIAVSTLRGVVSDPVVQQNITNWSLNLYTDYASYVYVGNYSSGGLTCHGCGVFLRFAASSSSAAGELGTPTTTPDEQRLGVNYLLRVTNASFVPALLRYGSIPSPRPFLVLLASNVTWGRSPVLQAQPDGSMELNRPVVLVGQAGITTALDMGMVANAVHLTGRYSNLTMHGLRHENLAFGDKRSSAQASGLSLINPFNYWMAFWQRQDARVMLVNCTSVASHQEAVEYLMYWQIMTSSSDPTMRAQAAWVARGPGITVWESLAFDKSLLDVKFVSRTMVVKDTWRVVAAQQALVFPRLPDNVDDPALYQTALKAHQAAPLAMLSGSSQQLQAWLSALAGLPREGLTVLVAPQLSVAADETTSWPPPAGITLKAPSTVLIGRRLCGVSEAAAEAAASAAGSSRASRAAAGGALSNIERVSAQEMPQRALLRGLGLSEAEAASFTSCAAEAARDTGKVSALDRLGHYPMLDLAQSRALLQLQPAGNSSTLELVSVTLVGLSQGPGIAAAAAPDASVGRRLAAAAAALAVPSLQGASSWVRLHPQQLRQLLSRRQLAAAGSAEPTSELSQANPAVWSSLVWAVSRTPGKGQLSLRNVALGLPAPEFQRLLAASRTSSNGAFSLPLTGAAPLTAKASSFVNDCCLLVSAFSAPGLNASQLLLFADPDTARAMPPGYAWPYDGSAPGQQYSRSTGSQQLSAGGIAGLVVGLAVALAAAAALVWVLAARRRRRRRCAAAAGDSSVSDLYKPSPSDRAVGSSSGKSTPHQHHGSSKGPFGRQRALAAGADASGGGSFAADQRGVRHGSSSSGGTPAAPGSRPGSFVDSAGGAGVFGNRRWMKLTTAISGRVQDIHHQRLRTALVASQSSGAVSPGGSGAPVAGGVASLQQAGEQQDSSQHALELKELLGRGTFGTVYRANWQGVNVAVKLLQLPPGAGQSMMSESGLFGGSGGGSVPGLLKAVSGWSNAAGEGAAPGGPGAKRGGLMRQEYMAVQEAAIGSTVIHPNIISVYSITLRPAGGAAASLTALDEDGSGGPGWGQQQQQRPSRSAASSLELLPWEMQLVMEWADQGSLREALDAGLLVDKGTGGLHQVGTVLSLAHNIACAMAYLHQEHIIHGDLKASNVLLKTCIPNHVSSSSLAPGGGGGGAAGGSNTPLKGVQGWTAGNGSAPPAAAAAASGSGSAPAGASASAAVPGTPAAVHSTGGGGAPDVAAAAAADGAGAGQQQFAGAVSSPPGQLQQQQQAASQAIINAAASATSENGSASGMQSLLKCGWVVAKVSDFGLSTHTAPEETHVSSVHAGTLTHMAPEMLMQGRISKSSDCYAFGILLWEVATGGKAFAGIPKPLLGHCVISQGMRPTWPPALRQQAAGGGCGSGAAALAWSGIIALTERCWAQEPQARPAFSEVVKELSRLLKGAPAAAATAAAGAGAALSTAGSSTAPTPGGNSSSVPEGLSGRQQQQPWSIQPGAGGWLTGLHEDGSSSCAGPPMEVVPLFQSPGRSPGGTTGAAAPGWLPRQQQPQQQQQQQQQPDTAAQ